jgi:hypothetical protein
MTATTTRMSWRQVSDQLALLGYSETEIRAASEACPGPGMQHTMPERYSFLASDTARQHPIRNGQWIAGTDSGGMWYITPVPAVPATPPDPHIGRVAARIARDNPDILGDRELVMAVITWAMSKGAIITRSWFGMNQDVPALSETTLALTRTQARAYLGRCGYSATEILSAELEIGKYGSYAMPGRHVLRKLSGGNFWYVEGPSPEETLRLADEAAAADDDLGDDDDPVTGLRDVFQHFISGRAPASARTAEFTVDGSGWYRITPGQRRILMSIATPAIRSLNGEPVPDNWPGVRAVAHDECPSCGAGLGGDDCGDLFHRTGDGVVLETFRTSGTWPELSRDWDVAEICAAIRVVDAHLDANTAQVYRDQPLAGDMSRIGKAQNEAREAMEALAGATGENPRKGVCDTWEHVLEELGDTACAALLGIQHKTKDTDATWAVFIAALAKALGRVPQQRPAPVTTTEGDQ